MVPQVAGAAKSVGSQKVSRRPPVRTRPPFDDDDDLRAVAMMFNGTSGRGNPDAVLSTFDLILGPPSSNVREQFGFRSAPNITNVIVETETDRKSNSGVSLASNAIDESLSSGFNVSKALDRNGDALLLVDVGISFELLCAMLKHENDLRLSEEIQEVYRKCGTAGWQSWLDLTCALQDRVAKEFGFQEKFGVMLVRCAESLVRDDPARVARVREISLYRKYNRVMDGDLVEGDYMPPLPNPLYKWTKGTGTGNSSTGVDTIAGSQVTLDDLTLAAASKPLVVLAGSYS